MFKLKNLDWKTMVTSKTFRAGLIALITAGYHAWGSWHAGAQMTALTTLGAGLSVFLGAIGIKDATSGPVN